MSVIDKSNKIVVQDNNSLSLNQILPDPVDDNQHQSIEYQPEQQPSEQRHNNNEGFISRSEELSPYSNNLSQPSSSPKGRMQRLLSIVKIGLLLQDSVSLEKKDFDTHATILVEIIRGILEQGHHSKHLIKDFPWNAILIFHCQEIIKSLYEKVEVYSESFWPEVAIRLKPVTFSLSSEGSHNLGMAMQYSIPALAYVTLLLEFRNPETCSSWAKLSLGLSQLDEEIWYSQIHVYNQENSESQQGRFWNAINLIFDDYHKESERIPFTASITNAGKQQCYLFFEVQENKMTYILQQLFSCLKRSLLKSGYNQMTWPDAFPEVNGFLSQSAQDWFIHPHITYDFAYPWNKEKLYAPKNEHNYFQQPDNELDLNIDDNNIDSQQNLEMSHSNKKTVGNQPTGYANEDLNVQSNLHEREQQDSEMSDEYFNSNQVQIEKSRTAQFKDFQFDKLPASDQDQQHLFANEFHGQSQQIHQQKGNQDGNQLNKQHQEGLHQFNQLAKSAIQYDKSQKQQNQFQQKPQFQHNQTLQQQRPPIQQQQQQQQQQVYQQRQGTQQQHQYYEQQPPQKLPQEQFQNQEKQQLQQTQRKNLPQQQQSTNMLQQQQQKQPTYRAQQHQQQNPGYMNSNAPNDQMNPFGSGSQTKQLPYQQSNPSQKAVLQSKALSKGTIPQSNVTQTQKNITSQNSKQSTKMSGGNSSNQALKNKSQFTVKTEENILHKQEDFDEESSGPAMNQQQQQQQQQHHQQR